MPLNKTVGGTYGSIFIERGDVDLGMQWVLFTIDMKHPNDSTLMASVYMMLGFHLKKDFKSRDKHLRYVQQNEGKLEQDSLLLWERCLKKVEVEKESGLQVGT